MSRRIIEGSYARLVGLRDAVSAADNPYLSRDFGDDYGFILKELRSHVDDEFAGFDISMHGTWHPDSNDATYKRDSIFSKTNQLISYLMSVHAASDRVVEIGSVYNLILDQELKSRCSDLLSATNHFDRVINQATQVLEDRVQGKVPDLKHLTGGHWLVRL